MTRLSVVLALLVAVEGFQTPGTAGRVRVASPLQASTSSSETKASSTSTPKTKTLGLLTFDLDDTLYPIDTVIQEANTAFARAMNNYGFTGIQPQDIVETSKKIREEMTAENPEAAAALSHTEIRLLAIRREMENVIFHKKLKDTADDWATPVSSLSPVVVSHAKKWASEAVSPSIVQAVMNAWEMERHHAAERHLYQEVMDVLSQIKKEHPGVIIGAVTDGKANPAFMTFTLAKHFDFCVSWEDDQGARRKFFKELANVEGNAELKWIYKAALDKYQELASANAALKKGADEDPNKVWIHVGDDLAYDVGGAASCGAKTILVELADKYGQTARHRFDDTKEQPSWSVTTKEELKKRFVMNEAAREFVNAKISFLTRLPEAIDDILAQED
ncbi:hypothetical protein FisN_13Hh071 [Fistulifera solaris]|uniref:Uncharacterized protein n=1 Tax=Fistulifera solaris TaxID=1519565 RepID=A0A1Z5KP04_FISSO|nr:hypothetical protein FisN_13Hh071 [Fistulifera solaris]|eukprot:GAX27822.1 hypothetical protein FisN_13Hh071 [Fistulifera solaris]